MKLPKARWRTAPVRYLIFLVWLAACSVELVEEGQDFLPPEQLSVTKGTFPPPLRTLILVDTSGSNTFRGKMNQEVMALVGRTQENDNACIIPISSDSRQANSQPYCLGQVGGVLCEHPPVRDTDFYNPQEEEAYTAARARLAQETEQCMAEVVTRRSDRPMRLQVLESKLSGYPVAHKTDITGAIFRALQQVTDAGTTELWIYSDMEEDPMYASRAELAINLTGGAVHVRQLTPYGRGYSTAMQEKWTPKFTGWGATVVDWKDFTLGEFAQNVGSESASVEPVPVGEPPAAEAPPEPPSVDDRPTARPTTSRPEPKPVWSKPKFPDNVGIGGR